MDRFVENPNSCHSVSFKYSLDGDNPGQLSLQLRTQDGETVVRELWSTSQVTNGWVAVEDKFRYWDRFKVPCSPNISPALCCIHPLK